MSTITLTFTNAINSSLQKDDYVFFTNTSTVNNYTVGASSNKFLGTVNSITGNSIVVTLNDDDGEIPSATNTFFYFVKNRNVNQAGLKGYYSEVKIQNSSTLKAELFSLGSEVVESSK